MVLIRLLATGVSWSALRWLAPIVVIFLPDLALAQQPEAGRVLTNCLAGPRATFEGLATQNDDDVSLADPSRLVYAAVGCAQDTAIAVFLPLAQRLLAAFAIIILVWTGVQMMLQGGLDMGSLISTLLSIALPVMILDGYGAGSYVWGDIAFTDIFVNTARWASEALISNSFDSFVDQLVAMWRRVEDAFYSADNADAGLWNSIKNAFGFVTGAVGALFVGYVIGFFAIGVLLFILTPPVMLYCQYLWGLVTMLVAILLGPIFVPFLLIPQLSFLFWGWIRSLFGGMIHSIVSAGLFVIIANLMLLPIQSFVNYLAAPDDQTSFFDAIGLSFAALFLYVPIVILAYLVSFRVSEITGMVLGGGVPSAGLAEAAGGFRPRGAKSAGGGSGG